MGWRKSRNSLLEVRDGDGIGVEEAGTRLLGLIDLCLLGRCQKCMFTNQQTKCAPHSRDSKLLYLTKESFQHFDQNIDCFLNLMVTC